MVQPVPTSFPDADPALRARLTALFDEGWTIWDRFDAEVRQRQWHPFVHSDYECALEVLLTLRAPGRTFLEWGSATGIITIMADLLGFEAYGIELDAELVETARTLADRHGSSARFVNGSFIPSGWRPRTGDGRLGTLGAGPSAYFELGRSLDDFDVIYAYPWKGEEELMLDVMRCYGDREASLLLYGGGREVRIFRGGRGELR